MSARFEIGDIVWYQKSGGKNSFAKARITSVCLIGKIASYSIQRFDMMNLPIHHVSEAHLMAVVDRNRAADAANV